MRTRQLPSLKIDTPAKLADEALRRAGGDQRRACSLLTIWALKAFASSPRQRDIIAAGVLLGGEHWVRSGL